MITRIRPDRAKAGMRGSLFSLIASALLMTASVVAAEAPKIAPPVFPYGAVYFRKSNPPEQDWARDHQTAARIGM